MIDFYYWPTPNGWKVSIMLEELGIKYRMIPVNISKGEQFTPKFLTISPNNRMPAIVDHNPPPEYDGKPVTIFESGAILLHLAEHHGGEIAAPGDRSLISQWTHFANSTLAFAIFVPDQKTKVLPRLLKQLDQQLSEGSLVGNSWGAADCAVTAYLAYIKLFFPSEDLSAYPTIEALIAATQQRPAYRKVMGMG